MLRMVCAIFCVALLLISCQSNESKVEQPEAVQITVAEFNDNAENYADQAVTLTGTVSHICAHGGKKMFVFGDDQDMTVKVDASTDIGSFPQELTGSKVKINGVVKVMKVDEAYLNNWENEVTAAGGEDVTEKEGGTGVCAAEEKSSATVQASATESEGEAGEEAGEEAEGSGNESLDQINALRQQLADSGKEYLGFYSIECTSYEELH